MPVGRVGHEPAGRPDRRGGRVRRSARCRRRPSRPATRPGRRSRSGRRRRRGRCRQGDRCYHDRSACRHRLPERDRRLRPSTPGRVDGLRSPHMPFAPPTSPPRGGLGDRDRDPRRVRCAAPLDDHLGRHRRPRRLRPERERQPRPLVSRGGRPSRGRRPRRRAGASRPGPCPPPIPSSVARTSARASSASTPATDGLAAMLVPRHASRPPCGSSPPEAERPMYFDEFKHQLPDIDAGETEDWLTSLDQVVRRRGREPGPLPHVQAPQAGPPAPRRAAAAHPDPLHQHDQPGAGAVLPGRRGASSTGSGGSSAGTPSRWSSGRTRATPGIGGHLATYASAASLYEVGFNHFFRGKDDAPGDQIFYQGHAAPGMYARAFLEGRLTEDQLDHFRREVGTRGGTLLVPPSAAHARLLGVPDGEHGHRPAQRDLPGPLQPLPPQPPPQPTRAASASGPSSATARWTSRRRSPACRLAAREGLDNLTFVVNCNLQRLDGPVRGNGKIIQELEGLFRGAGWNVIKVIWGREWDDLLARDVDGVLVEKMNSTLDGEFQKFSVAGGRLHPGALLRARPAAPRARRAPVRRRPDPPPPRRPRLPQGVRRVQGRDRVHRRSDGRSSSTR